MAAAAVFLRCAGPAAATPRARGRLLPRLHECQERRPRDLLRRPSNLTICLARRPRGLRRPRRAVVEHEPRHGAQRAGRLARDPQPHLDRRHEQRRHALRAHPRRERLRRATPGGSGIAINGDRVALQRNLITNGYGPAGSCITNDADRGVADDTIISQNRIFDCGRDETHDHGIYTNAMNRPIVSANWIYENAGRGINLGPHTYDARFTRNVIADNCANPLGGPNDCSANIIYWGFTQFTDVQQQHRGLPALTATTSPGATSGRTRPTATSGPARTTSSRTAASTPRSAATAAIRWTAASAPAGTTSSGASTTRRSRSRTRSSPTARRPRTRGATTGSRRAARAPRTSPSRRWARPAP